MEDNGKPLLPVIVGPTATGKTEAAVLIAEELNAEIVSADSRQIYRGLEIGSGAPSKEQLQRVKHHLVGFLEPDVRFSAGEFANLAHDAIGEIQKNGKIPLVAGGSGLYIRALTDGLSPIPPSDKKLRAEIDLEIASEGMETMIGKLSEVDPDYAAKVGVNDRKRLVRALEVWRMTGKTFTQWHSIAEETQRYNPVIFGLSRPREELCDIINSRVRNMIDEGWVTEIDDLIKRYGDMDNLPPSVTESLGYKELLRCMHGEIDMDEAIEAITIATRQFAKRQMTWFRADKRIEWFEESGDRAVFNWSKRIIRRINELNC